jgi:hypothetical protein
MRGLHPSPGPDSHITRDIDLSIVSIPEPAQIAQWEEARATRLLHPHVWAPALVAVAVAVAVVVVNFQAGTGQWVWGSQDSTRDALITTPLAHSLRHRSEQPEWAGGLHGPSPPYELEAKRSEGGVLHLIPHTPPGTGEGALLHSVSRPLD